MTLIAIFVGLIFLYSLVSARLEKTVLTAPILFTVAGMLALQFLPELRNRQGNLEVFLRVAEVGLVLLLFTDASRTDLRILRNIRVLPARLLSTGLLLTILLGTLAALVVFRQLSVWEAGILGAILAPTDAGLGQVIVGHLLLVQLFLLVLHLGLLGLELLLLGLEGLGLVRSRRGTCGGGGRGVAGCARRAG